MVDKGQLLFVNISCTIPPASVQEVFTSEIITVSNAGLSAIKYILFEIALER